MRVPLLNFEGGPGVLLLNFKGGPGVALLNFRRVPSPTFKLWGGSRVPVPLLHHTLQHLSFNVSIALNLAYNKNKLYKTRDYWSRDNMLNFNFSEKGLGLVFQVTMFLILHSINWPNFIVWLPLPLEILDNTCIKINQDVTQ